MNVDNQALEPGAPSDSLSDERGAVVVEGADEIKKPALDALDRRVTLKDLKHPGVQKLILAKMDDALSQVAELRKYEQKFHDADKNLAVTKSTLDSVRDLDRIRSTMLALGGLFLGYVPAVWANKSAVAICLLAGVALLAACIHSKTKGAH